MKILAGNKHKYILLFVSLFANCALFPRGESKAPNDIHQYLRNTIVSKADSVKSQKILILEKFGQPSKKSLGTDKDSCWYYISAVGFEEICFDSAGKSTSSGEGIGIPEVKDIQEEYYSYDKRFRIGDDFDYCKAINKAFHLKSIEQMDSTLRIYFLPSFNLEIVYELNFKHRLQLFRYKSKSKSVWEDLQKLFKNSKGQETRGIVKQISEYTPSISFQIDSLSDSTLLTPLFERISSFGIDTMKCIRYKDIMTLDGTGFEIHINTGNLVNKIEFQESNYFDSRYVWIIDFIEKKMAGQFK